METKERIFTKIMVEIKGGAIVNITDLPKEQYEYFLELMHELRIAYISLTRRNQLINHGNISLP